MSKHTPGPWAIQMDGRDTRVVREADGLKSYVASLGEIWLCEEHGGTVDANAALIAAAPDLLAALKALLAHANAYSDEMRERGYGSMELGESADSASLAGMARAAIAKAEGR